MKARNRPPRLESRASLPVAAPAPPPSTNDLLLRARVAGRGPVGSSELRRTVARLAAGDAGALGGVGPLHADAAEVWSAVLSVYGARADRPEIEPDAVVAAAQQAGVQLAAAATRGAVIAFATSAPASMLGVYSQLGRLAMGAGASVPEPADAAAARIDGRSPRWIRWVEGVAMVTDGTSLLGADGPDASTEWLFHIGRPAVVVADGWFAEAAFESGAEVIAFCGLDRLALAVPAARGDRSCTLVPVHIGRPARAYRSLADALERAFRLGEPPEM